MLDMFLLDLPSAMGRRCLLADVRMTYDGGSGVAPVVRVATVHLESTIECAHVRQAQLGVINAQVSESCLLLLLFVAEHSVHEQACALCT
ncbi:hypothetical protein OAN61_00915 [bacterium]|nr:hypothetical protein [bacterium]